MKQKLLNIIDHRLLKNKNKILLKAIANESGEDKIIKTISNEIVKLILRLNKIKKDRYD